MSHLTDAAPVSGFHNRDTHPKAFPQLTPEQIEAFARIGRRQRYADGDVLFEQGERGYGFFVIEEGHVLVVGRSPSGDRPFAEHFPGEFSGDMGTVTRQAAVGAGIADGPVQVIRLNAEELQRVLSAEPVLGPLILQAFLLRRSILEETGYHHVRLIGSRWSEATHRLRDFLSRNRVLYRWVDPEDDAGAEDLLRSVGVNPRDLPVVVSHHTGVLVRPSARELATALGVSVPAERRTYDLIVIGGGPSGLAAAVYGASEGLSTILIEAVAPGGQAATSSKIENYLGFPTGLPGRELADRATAQAQKFGVHVHCPARVTGMACTGSERVVELDGEAPIVGRTVIVATGAEYRRLPADGIDRFEGVGVYYAATAMEGQLCEGNEVIVVGGGNSAGQAAVFLAQYARRVRLMVRAEGLADSMSRYLIDRIDRSDDIELLTHTEVTACHGTGRLEQVTLCTRDGNERTTAASALFAMIGATPNTGWLDGCVGLDTKGFVVTGQTAEQHDAFDGHWHEDRRPFYLETTRPGVFAVGDVRSGSIKRVASAVGEGSMALAYVHEVLAHGARATPVAAGETRVQRATAQEQKTSA